MIKLIKKIIYKRKLRKILFNKERMKAEAMYNQHINQMRY